MAFAIASQLPGWEMILFIALVIIFLLVGGIITFVILARLKWPEKYVIISDTAGKGYSISKRGKCRVIGFGDGGEEIVLLQHLNKYRVGYGKRIGPKQIAFVVAQDGLWYQSSFGDFDKALRELGLLPTSVNIRLGMASVRKGLEKRLEPKDWMAKYGVLVGMGLLFLMMLVAGGMTWYSTQQQAKIASSNAASINISLETQVATQKTLSVLDNILSKVNIQLENGPTANGTIIGGSGLTPAS